MLCSQNDYQRCILPSALIFRPMPGKDGTPGRHHFLDATTLKPQEEWVINDAQAHQVACLSAVPFMLFRVLRSLASARLTAMTI